MVHLCPRRSERVRGVAPAVAGVTAAVPESVVVTADTDPVDTVTVGRTHVAEATGASRVGEATRSPAGARAVAASGDRERLVLAVDRDAQRRVSTPPIRRHHSRACR